MKQIKKTFILSRHTLRKPLYEMIPFSHLIQNDNWYVFPDNGMQITDKGVILQERVVEALKEFLPDNTKIKMCANDTKRTIETANIFKEMLNGGDILVDQTLFYNTEDLDTSIDVNIQEYIDSIDKKRLQEAKKEIKKIALSRNLDVFTDQEDISSISLKDNGFLRFRGELATYSKISDILMTEFYETGKGDVDLLRLIAYPKIISLNISSGRMPYCAVPIKKIYDSMNELFNSDKDDVNTLIYVAHDSTIMALAHFLGINLPTEYCLEPTPIGSSFVVTQDYDNKLSYYLVYVNNIDFRDIVIDKLNG